MGMLAGQTGRASLAVDLLSRAAASAPTHAEYQGNLGSAFLMAGRIGEAVTAFQRAVQLQPDYPEAHRNLGVALNLTGQRDAAIAEFQKTLALQPANLAAILNLGNVYLAAGRPDEAAAQFRHALRLKPDFVHALNNLGMAQASQGNLRDAMECCRRAFTINPDFAQAQSNLIYTLHLDPAADDAALRSELDFFARRFADPFAKSPAQHASEPDPARRLRIGYLSPDFREHPVARFLVDFLAAHDHRQFEIHCFHDHMASDAMTGRLQPHADRWHNVAGIPDAQLAGLIRASEIDILIDLASHTGGNRLRALARRPAPLQVTYLAYCSTTGMKAVDYRLSDARLDPPDDLPAWYAEKTLYLPESYWCYSLPSEAPEPAPMPVRSRGQITFGCLNSLSKVSGPVIEAWSAILKGVPNSRLLLHAPVGTHRQRYLDLFAAQGIDAARIEYVPYLPLPDYFRMYHQIDIALDPFPFAGATTTCDALYMGVPVITLRGKRAVGRSGVSILTSLSLLELIGNSVDQYVQLAIKLAHDCRTMTRYRGSLRGMMQKSALMSPERFTRNLERAFRRIWITWCSRKQNP
jgi:predicted O-linked N-acetylglucosamine transferase (SPINDLY family)